MEWEYRTYVLNANKSFFGGKFKEESLDDVLNQFGKEGWELINTVTSNRGYGETRAIIFLFKRVKKQD